MGPPQPARHGEVAQAAFGAKLRGVRPSRAEVLGVVRVAGGPRAVERRRILAPLGIALLIATSCADDEGGATPACDAAILRERLSAAAGTPGAVVEVGACTVAGPIEVPAGVTLRGSGRASTILVSAGDAPVVALASGRDETVVEHLTLQVTGFAGILGAAGEGSVRVSDVRVEVSSGVGVGLAGRAVELRDVEIGSTVEPGVLAELPPLATHLEGPTYGLVVLDAPHVSLADVSVHGFARAGVALVRSPADWAGGTIAECRGIGLGVWEGRAALDAVGVERTLRGRVLSTMAVLAAAGGELSTRDVVLADNDAIGVLHDDASGAHDGLDVHGSRGPALWTQRSGGLRVSDASISGNRIAGLLALDAGAVLVERTTIAETALGVPPGSFGDREPTADGIEVVRDDGQPLDVTLDTVTLAANERVGVLLDAGGAGFGASRLQAVRVDGTGEALGAVAQRVEGLPATWDDSVERAGATALNDERFADLLAAVGIVMPPELPAGLGSGSLDDLFLP